MVSAAGRPGPCTQAAKFMGLFEIEKRIESSPYTKLEFDGTGASMSIVDADQLITYDNWETFHRRSILRMETVFPVQWFGQSICVRQIQERVGVRMGGMRLFTLHRTSIGLSFLQSICCAIHKMCYTQAETDQLALYTDSINIY